MNAHTVPVAVIQNGGDEGQQFGLSGLYGRYLKLSALSNIAVMSFEAGKRLVERGRFKFGHSGRKLCASEGKGRLRLIAHVLPDGRLMNLLFRIARLQLIFPRQHLVWFMA